MSKLEFGKGAAYLYIETITAMFSGYLFWLILSRITTTEIIGTSSAVVSFATIFITVATIGVPNGVQRFLGKSFFEKKIQDSKVSVKASTLIVSIGIVGSSVLILVTKDWILNVFRIDFSLVAISLLLIASSSFYNLFRSIVIASLKIKILTVISILTTIAKFAVTLTLLLVGMGALGIIIGYTLFPILVTIILISTSLIFKPSKGIHPATRQLEYTFSTSFKNILTASMVFWIPLLISTIGSQLGTIVVFGAKGANQAGFYFIALSITIGIATVMSVLSAVAYPTLGAMQDGRKRFAWRITKISLIMTLPFSSSVIFYSKEIMQLFGKNYIEGSSNLEILLLSMLPTAVMSGISMLVYSYGNYRQVLAIGLVVSIPRTILYFILVPLYGGVGASISYTTGSVLGFIVSIIIAKKVRMKISWKELPFMLLVPMGLAFVFGYFRIDYIIGIPVILVLSYVLLLKLQVIDKSDLRDFLDILPLSIANPLLNIIKKLNRS